MKGLQRALELAALGRHSAAPNPMVGAVLVADGEVVGEAYHRAAGEPHAEILALQQAGERARGSTLYINLEPCCHQGRTGPCAPRIIEAGVSKVVVGLLDPDPRVRGGGVALLREAGIEVELVDSPESLSLNRSFVHSVLFSRPFVTLKYAMTLDGRVATATGDSRWITGPGARHQVHQERAAHQAVMAGSGTCLADDPRLNVRGVNGAPQPLRVVLDRRGRLPASASLFNAPGGPVWIGYGNLAEQTWQDEMRQAGAELFHADDLSAALTHLHQHSVRSLFLEGGPTLAGAFVDQGLVQRLLVYLAPVLVGATAAPGPLQGQGVEKMAEALRVNSWRVSEVEGDLCLEAELDSRWRDWVSPQ